MEIAYRPPDRDKYLLADEIERLLSAAKKQGAFPFRFLQFMANTGVRPSESNRIHAFDFHVNENRVHVQTIKQKKESKKDGTTTEARTIFRDIDIAPEYAKEVGAWVSKLKPDSIVFGVSRCTMWRMFKRSAKAAGLPSTYTLYSLRHSRAIYLLEWMNDLDYTSKQLGHASTEITRVYLHCLPSKREEYVKRMKAY